MKAEIKYIADGNYINVEITDNDRTLEDIEQTARIVKYYQEEFNTNKLFYDHSKFAWKFDYLNEYKLAKDFDKFLPFPKNTKMAFFLGEFYDDKYWELMRKLIRDNSNISIEYFGSLNKALDWLLDDEQ